MTIWYAIRTRAQKEFDVAKDLDARGHTVFLPVEVIRTKSRHKEKPIDKRRPLIPGYIFVAYQAWHDHKHVTGCVMMGGEPVKIFDNAMAPLYHATGRLIDHTPKKAKAFAIGDVVKIAIGQFAGQTVTIGKIIKGKVQVAMTLFGSERIVTVNKGALAA